MGITESNFIKACYGQNEGPLPIWIMRQAGRYLPEYLEVRNKVSFLELCRSPELIAEVVRQPIARFNFDAGILFSDILTMLEPMGMKIDFPNGGPVIDQPITIPDDVNRLKDFDIESSLSFVLDGIREIKKVIPETPLIGFVGSPFTLACYLIEGQGSSKFDKAKAFLHRYPQASKELFDLLSRVIIKYLKAQIKAGVNAIQIFESWGGILSYNDFNNWSAKIVDNIFTNLKDENVPRIYFINNVAPYIDMVRDVDCEVVGVDYRMDLASAAMALKGKSVQGNLDPTILFGSPEYVTEKATALLDSLNNHNNLIFNLGHGILPKTPLDSVSALVETVRNYRK